MEKGNILSMVDNISGSKINSLSKLYYQIDVTLTQFNYQESPTIQYNYQSSNLSNSQSKMQVFLKNNIKSKNNNQMDFLF